MGQLVYGLQAEVISIEDRALAHLRVVMLAKLRRRESFAFNSEYDNDNGNGAGRLTAWMSTDIPVIWKFSGPEQHTINRAWLDILMVSANSPEGLRLLPEPEATGS